MTGALTDIAPLVASALVSFAATYTFLPWLIRSLRGTTAVGKDLNKLSRPIVPEMGGLGVILGFYVGVALLTIWAAAALPTPFYFASLTAALGAGVVGLMDDVFRLRNRAKALLPFLLAVPLGAVSYASGDVYLLGVNIGILTVIVVPLGVTSAANAANMLEGLNGLGAGMGVIMASALIGLELVSDSTSGLYILLPLLGALLAFLLFNKFPAKVFPGDSMTLFMGAALASAAIVSHEKTLGALLFVPMIVEFGLKVRGRFRAENYGEPDSSGRLHYAGRVQSLTHFVMKRRPMKEWQVVASLWLLEGLVSLAVVVVAVVLK